MKLKYIELYGFKSFKEKTKLYFNKDISAIVGPNGSGKSNIADAIKWVLGEQSAKSLRGFNMQDVIFTGTDKYKPMNMAQVSLILDNSDGSLPISFNEVNVTRRVYRTGESEYLLNKSSVRLKDIKELFLDTGIGKDGYSMIGQGRIDEILNGKNEDRRYIFEEATGIAKNKYKKTESERKLAKNEENLSHLSQEIKIKQQETDILQKQADNAKEGIKLTSRLELLELNILYKAIEKAKSELIKDKATLEYSQKLFNENNSRLKKLESKILPVESQIEEKTVELDEIRKLALDSEKNLQKYISDIELSNEKIKFFSNDIKRLKDDISIREERLSTLEKKLIEITTNSKDLLAKKGEMENNLKKLNEEISSISLEKNSKADKLLNLKGKLESQKIKISDLIINKSTKEKLDDSNVKLKDNYTFEIELIRKNIVSIDEKFERYKSELSKVENKIEENTNTISLTIEKREVINKELNQLSYETSQLKNNLIKLDSTREILEKQYFSYEGYYKSVQNLLLAAKKDQTISSKIVGVLADLIQISDEYKIALDVALGSSLQNIVVETDVDGKFLIDYIKKKNIGRITFLPISKIYASKVNVKHNRVINTLDNLVKHDKNIEGIVNHFLSRTLIVKDMNDAILVSNDLKGYRIITLDGEVINSWGSMVGGQVFKKEGNSLLNRKKELDEIITKIKKLNLEIASSNYILSQKKNVLDNIMYELQSLDQSNSDLISEKRTKISEIREFEIEKDFNLKRIEEFNQLILEIDEKLQKEDFSEIDILENNVQSIQTEINSLESSIESLNALFTDKDKELVKLNSEYEVSMRDASILSDDIEEIQLEIENESTFIDTNKKNLEFSIQEMNKLSNVSDDSKNSIDILKKSASDFSEKTKILEEDLSKLKADTKNDRIEIDRLRMDIVEIEKEIYKIQLKISNSQEKVDSLINDYIDTYSIDEDLLNRKLDSIEIIDATRKEVLEIKNRLSEIGFFNFESIEKYNLASEELDFMKTQYEDLIKTRDDIIEMIKSIEKEMIESFTKTFAEIQIKFNEIFKILFNGGEAEVKLDSNDVLSAGIEIIARPPGKKLKSLGLMSGGEKALTAVALLFAIFEINPAPFCLLDEIDAALDEANIKRYINYLKSLVDKSQFIIITHRKTTMEMAEVLYGVTMEEQGVSKLVTLQLED